MSKRFGRNQRRRAREQIAALRDENGMLSVKASFQESSLHAAAIRVRMLEQQLSNAKIVIGRNHPAFPAERMNMGFMPAPGHRFQMHTGPSDIATMAMLSITTNRDVVFNEVHFRLTHGDVQAGYALSECAIRRALRSEEETRLLCQRVTEELVQHTIGAFRELFSRPGGAV